MKKFQITTTIFLALAAFLALSGCKKHKPNLPPPQGQAPTVTAPSTVTAPPTAQPPQPPQTSQTQTSQTSQSSASKPAPKPPKPHSAHAPAKKPGNGTEKQGTEKQGAEIAKVTPPKIVIQEAPAPASSSAAAVTPLLAHDDAAHNQASTAQLNDSTESNLNSIKRQLSTDEQSTVSQIRDYLAQSHQATKDGDLARARNLALKAHLLSDELVKPR
jgi:hypothetical protein